MDFNHDSLIAIVLNDLAILPRDCNSIDVSALALKHHGRNLHINYQLQVRRLSHVNV